MKNLFLIIFVFFSSFSLVAQPFGTAIVLNGSSNFVSIPNATTFNITNNLTLEAWLKPCDLTGHNMIFSKQWCSGSQFSYYFTIQNGKLKWAWSPGSCNSTTNVYESTNVVVQANTWQHVAIVHTSTGVTFYLNGVVVPGILNAGAYSVLSNSTEPLRIGTYRGLSGVYGLFFGGFIDEARVWNTNLSSASILSRYNAPLIGNEANLIAYYPMNVTGSGNGVVVTNAATATGFGLNGSTIGSGTSPFFSTGQPLPNLGNDTAICSGSSLLLDVTLSGGNYLWQDGSILPTFNVTQSDTIIVDRSIVTGCINSDTVVVTVDSLNLSLGNDTFLCSGQTLVLDATVPNASHLWQDSSTDSTFTVSQSGSYWVQANTSCGTVTDTIQVNVIPFSNLNLGNDTILCFGQNVVLDATVPNATYSWQNSSTDSTFTVVQTGNYWVEVTTMCDTISDTIQVNVLPANSVDLGNDTVLCFGQTLVLDATYLNATYTWQNSSTDSTFTVSQAGLYWVEVISLCDTVSDTISVGILNPTNLNLGNDTLLCSGQNLILDATTPTATYSWQNSSTDSTFTVVQTGVYWVEVTTLCDTVSDTIQVNIIPSSTVNLGNDTVLCSGQSLVLDATVPNATYSWQNSSTDSTFTVTQSGLFWVEVINLCDTILDSINVGYINPITINLGNDTVLCSGQSLVLNATVPNATYSWQDGSTNATFIVTQNGSYSVTVTTLCGTVSDTIQVNYLQLSNINIGNDTSICVGQNLILNANTANASYLWQDNTNASTLIVTTAGNYWVEVTVGNCNVRDSITVGIESLPVVFLGNDTSLCNGEVLVVDASSSIGAYLWQDGSTSPYYVVKNSGNYWVEVSNQCGTVKDDVTISYINIDINLGNDTALCSNKPIVLEAQNANSTYLWQDGSQNSKFEVVEPGTYWVEVRVQNCISADTIAITELIIEMELQPDTTLCLGTEIAIGMEIPNSTYLWTDNSTEPYLDVRDSGTFILEISNNCGRFTDTVIVNFEDCNCNVFIPNAFHPNGDDLNELFKPENTCTFENYQFIVYDRWGHIMFESVNPLNGWDGRGDGVLAPQDMYSYVLNYYHNGSPIMKTGSVLLIR